MTGKVSSGSAIRKRYEVIVSREDERTDLMTREEFTERWPPNGYRLALNITIEKWKRARRPKNWPLLLAPNGIPSYLSAKTCGLCHYYQNYCPSCPLAKVESCSGNPNTYQGARRAIEIDNYVEFRRCAQNIIAICMEELAKLDIRQKKDQIP